MYTCKRFQEFNRILAWHGPSLTFTRVLNQFRKQCGTCKISCRGERWVMMKKVLMLTDRQLNNNPLWKMYVQMYNYNLIGWKLYKLFPNIGRYVTNFKLWKCAVIPNSGMKISRSTFCFKGKMWMYEIKLQHSTLTQWQSELTSWSE